MEASAVPIQHDASDLDASEKQHPPHRPHRSLDGDVDGRRGRTTDLLARANEPGLDEQERQRILDLVVRLNIPVADSLARRYRSRGEDLEDLTQVARMGLVQAVRRFDPDSGPFLSFAVPTITGEIKRHFRDHCWTVRPPRRIQELHGEVSAAWAELAQQHGSSPTAAQIADWLDADRDDVLEAMRSNAFTSASLDAVQDGSGSTDVIGARDPGYDEVDEAADRRQLMQEVRTACTHLSVEERRVLQMRFEEGRSQSSIAAELGVSQMSVSRRLRKITTSIRVDVTRHRNSTPRVRIMRNRQIGTVRRQGSR